MKADIRWFEIIDSTNNEALRQLQTAPELTFFASEFQTKGRGQKGNHWESAKGENLTFSILIKPNFLPIGKQFVISQIVTLALKKYFDTIKLNVRIKWPNDIYIGDNKICGILIENHFSDVNLSASIIGIGININQTIFDSGAPNPTSLKLETGREYLLNRELENFSKIFTDFYISLKENSRSDYFKNIEFDYLKSLYRFGEFHKYENLKTGKLFIGKIIGLNENACILIESEDGTVESYAFKEIKYS